MGGGGMGGVFGVVFWYQQHHFLVLRLVSWCMLLANICWLSLGKYVTKHDYFPPLEKECLHSKMNIKKNSPQKCIEHLLHDFKCIDIWSRIRSLCNIQCLDKYSCCHHIWHSAALFYFPTYRKWPCPLVCPKWGWTLVGEQQFSQSKNDHHQCVITISVWSPSVCPSVISWCSQHPTVGVTK